MPAGLLHSRRAHKSRVFVRATVRVSLFDGGAAPVILDVLGHRIEDLLAQARRIGKVVPHHLHSIFFGKKRRQAHIIQFFHPNQPIPARPSGVVYHHHGGPRRGKGPPVHIMKHQARVPSIRHPIVPGKEIYVVSKDFLPAHRNGRGRARSAHGVVPTHKVDPDRSKDVLQVAFHVRRVGFVVEIPVARGGRMPPRRPDVLFERDGFCCRVDDALEQDGSIVFYQIDDVVSQGPVPTARAIATLEIGILLDQFRLHRQDLYHELAFQSFDGSPVFGSGGHGAVCVRVCLVAAVAVNENRIEVLSVVLFQFFQKPPLRGFHPCDQHASIEQIGPLEEGFGTLFSSPIANTRARDVRLFAHRSELHAIGMAHKG
mmetsp:Transcript_115735/g.236625  ORF Transcript_115735/g.236625 Transcript_115735/m.236625 type:complete len:372 (+) Transcript_115735:1169-2284(+)